MKTTGNSTVTKTKQHHAQSRSPASTPSTSKEKRNTNSEETIEELLLCLEKLEKKVDRLSGELNVTKRINTLLSQEVDDLQQYQRRSCIITDGINHDEDESIADITSKAKNMLNKHLQISKEEIEKQVDKCHRIGPKNDDGTQATILKFKSHSFKESVYMQRRKSRTEKSESRFPSPKKGVKFYHMLIKLQQTSPT